MGCVLWNAAANFFLSAVWVGSVLYVYHKLLFSF
jgi:hypothetical protein